MTDSSTEKLERTPLFEAHRALGGKMVPFAGWEMPVQYQGLIPEHRTVRNAVGLFDVSHMGEIFVEGPEAEAAINYLSCNDVRAIGDGKAQYSALLNERGGVVDDIIVYRFTAERYLICVNASNAAKDFAWMERHNRHAARLTNRSAEFGQIAVQGPRAVELITALPGLADAGGVGYFHFVEREMNGVPLIVARTGYTGEDGFELFIPWERTVAVWHELLERGAPYGVAPIGLGARDTLRLEACYPLHGHELSEEVSALESGLGWIVKLEKGDFIGREALRAEKAAGSKRALVGFVLEEAGVARHENAVLSETGEVVGTVTSGTQTPTVNRALGMALVSGASAAEGTPILIEVRGRRMRATVVKRPFYKKPN